MKLFSVPEAEANVHSPVQVGKHVSVSLSPRGIVNLRENVLDVRARRVEQVEHIQRTEVQATPAELREKTDRAEGLAP